MKKILSIILCLATVFGIFGITATAVSASDFTDVSENDWFFDEVNYVVEEGLFNGISATSFAPQSSMTRGMIVAILHRLAGEPETDAENAFLDVPADAYYAKAVAWANHAEVVMGTSKTTFSPDENVTREQAVSMIYRYHTGYRGCGDVGGKALDEFKDAASVSSYAEKAMQWAYGNGILNGNDGNILPQNSVTRCELAALICRYISFAEQEKRADMRIVCLAPSMVEVVYALGYGDCIVGWSAYTDYPVAATETEGYQPYQYYYYTNTEDFDVDYELGRVADENGEYKAVATVSKFYDYNAEILEALNPTLVLCEGSEQENWMNPESDAYLCDKYNAYCFTPESIDEIYDMMIEVGELLGCKEYAEELVAGYYQRIEEIKAITSELTPIRTYFEIAHQSDYGEYGKYGPYTEGGDTPFDEMIQIAGGENLFSDGEGYINLYQEYGEDAFAEIVSRDPQVIMSPYWPGAYDFEVTSLYEIMTRPGFCDTEAVQTGRVYYYDSSLMKRFGPRTITAIEKLAYLLHPYYFDNPENSVSPWELGKIDVAENFPAPLD